MKRFAPLLACLLFSACASVGRRSAAVTTLASAESDFKAGRLNAVIAALDQKTILALPRKTRANAYLLLGRSLRMHGNHDKALQVFQLAEGLHPRDINLLTELAGVLHRIGLDDRARPYYERVLEIHPNNAASNFGLAEIHRSQGHLSASQKRYELALSEEGWSVSPDIWLAYGELLLERRQDAKAAGALERALSLAETPDALFAMAKVEKRLGRLSAATDRLRRARELDPQRADFSLRAGLWSLDEGRLDAALSDAQSVLSVEPNHPLARWLRASALLRQGKKSEASADLAVAASASQESPFIASIARLMLDSLLENR